MTEHRIVHLVGQLGRGGTERQLLRVASGLARRGFEQTIVTFAPGEAWDAEVPAAGLVLRGVARDATFGFRSRELAAIVRDERPAVVHSWSAHTNVYLAGAALSPSVRRVASLRWNPASRARQPGVPEASGQRLAQIFALTRADAVVSNSQHALRVVTGWGVQLDTADVIPNAIPAAGRARPGSTKADAVPLIVAVGRLAHVKGFDVLVAAASVLDGRGVPFTLEIVGDGPARVELQDAIATAGLAARVRLVGAVDDVGQALARAHIAVQSSRSEGMPNGVLEAMAEGLPVVATAVGGTSEIVEQGVSGLLVAADDPDGLAGAMQRLLRDGAERARLGAAGLAFVSQHCAPDAVLARHQALYRRLLDARAS